MVTTLHFLKGKNASNVKNMLNFLLKHTANMLNYACNNLKPARNVQIHVSNM